MSDKFKNKYRIPSARLQTWDYGNNGSYFITICTKNREHYFGEIVDGEMQLNETGKLAEHYWMGIPNHFPFIELRNFVVMPNHVHGILIIDKPNVETRLIASLQTEQTEQTEQTLQTEQTQTPEQTPKKQGGFSGDKNPMFHENISRICRWYKGRCSFEMRKTREDFTWQSHFHDHIIRNAESFERIQNYIATNPLNWKDDKFNS